MAKKAILQIKETELSARTLIKNARDAAAQLLESAERERADEFARFSEDSRRLAREKKEQVRDEAEKESLEFAAETEKLCQELEVRLLSRKDSAIKALIEAARGF